MISPILDVYKKTLLQRTLPMITQYAEAHRKPRWVPVAKSKMFRIPKRPVITEEERVELLRINNNYKTQMRAIRKFYRDELVKELSSSNNRASEESLRVEREDWERCLKLNEEWNANISVEREKRRAEQLHKMEQYALARMEAKDLELEQRIAKASAEIRKQKELSSTFITPETIDAAIDEAIANPVDYNYAIDLKGQQTIGRETEYVKDKGTSNTTS